MLRAILKRLGILTALLLIFWSMIGCFGYSRSDILYYYDDITIAINDIKNNTIGKHSVQNGLVSVMKNKNGVFIDLYDDIELQAPIRLENVTINLNKFTINSSGFNIGAYGNITIENGTININSGNTDLSGIIIGRASSCTIDNLILNTTCENAQNVAIFSYGTLCLKNSIVSANNSGDENQRVTGVYGNLFSKISIESCNIQASTAFGRVFGVYIGDSGEISNSKIVAWANYDSSDTDYTSLSIGCDVDGPTTIVNCDIYGVHSGINATSHINVNGGTYSGYGHGGIYFSGSNKTSYVKNAVVQEADLPDGYQTFKPGATHGGCYIGGGIGQSNIQVFMDNCVLIGQKYGIVLRGSDGEENNAVYISNSTLNKNYVRIDNETHRLFIGPGCNIDVSMIKFQNVVIPTQDTYE